MTVQPLAKIHKVFGSWLALQTKLSLPLQVEDQRQMC